MKLVLVPEFKNKPIKDQISLSHKSPLLCTRMFKELVPVRQSCKNRVTQREKIESRFNLECSFLISNIVLWSLICLDAAAENSIVRKL